MTKQKNKKNTCLWEKVDGEKTRTECKNLHDSVIQFIFWDGVFCPHCGKKVEMSK